MNENNLNLIDSIVRLSITTREVYNTIFKLICDNILNFDVYINTLFSIIKTNHTIERELLYSISVGNDEDLQDVLGCVAERLEKENISENDLYYIEERLFREIENNYVIEDYLNQKRIFEDGSFYQDNDYEGYYDDENLKFGSISDISEDDSLKEFDFYEDSLMDVVDIFLNEDYSKILINILYGEIRSNKENNEKNKYIKNLKYMFNKIFENYDLEGCVIDSGFDLNNLDRYLYADMRSEIFKLTENKDDNISDDRYQELLIKNREYYAASKLEEEVSIAISGEYKDNFIIFTLNVISILTLLNINNIEEFERLCSMIEIKRIPSSIKRKLFLSYASYEDRRSINEGFKRLSLKK